MTTRTTIDATLAARPFDASDVEQWAIDQAQDEISAVHSFPNGGLVASQPGARLHLLAYPDATEGAAAIPAQPAQPAGDPIPPDVEGSLVLAGSVTGHGPVPIEIMTVTSTMFTVFDITIPSSPSGAVWDQGLEENGAYVGFVGGQLVLRSRRGLDMRIDAVQAGITGKSGKLYVEFTTNGTARVWWLENGSIQIELIGSEANGLNSSWAARNGGFIGDVNGTANIEGGSAIAPSVRAVRQTHLVGSDRSFDLPSFQTGDTLIATVTVHNYTQDGAADCTIPGWTRILDFDGQSNNAAPCVFVFRRTASSSNNRSIQVSGPTAGWQKTVTVHAIENASAITATFGDARSASSTQINVAAGTPTSALTMHMITSNHAPQIPLIPGDTAQISNVPEERMQKWSTGSNAATTLTGLASQQTHTSITVSVSGDIVGEGTSPFNGNITETRFYHSQAPANILDPGSFATPATPPIPEIPSTSYFAGSPDSSWAQADAGQFLEAVRARIFQSRTGAGVWTARLFARSQTGEVIYSAAVASPFDTADDGQVRETVFAAQTAVGDGTLFEDLIGQGWALGVLLETVTSDSSAVFGQARIQSADLRLLWATPPPPTILYPSGNGEPSATLQIGWTAPVDETQTGYQVRVWASSDFDSANIDGSTAWFDSGRVNSSSVRSHQTTRPMLPDTNYVIGLRLYGEQINGRTLTSAWSTVDVISPAAHIDPSPFEATVATPNADGTVSITAPLFPSVPAGDWAIIERSVEGGEWEHLAPFASALISQDTAVTPVEFVDHTAPLGVPIEYRIRAIQERGPFDIQSSTWTQLGPVTITSSSGWLSTLDGSERHRIDPTDISWTNDLPNQIAAGVGVSGHTVTRDVRKAADMSLTMCTYDRTEYQSLVALLESGDHLWLTDVHGRVFLVQPVDTLGFQPIPAHRLETETWPTRHMYEITTRLIEVEDPRAFGYGLQL